MNKFVMMYCNIWPTRPPGECWKALHQPEVIYTRPGRALSIHPTGTKKFFQKIFISIIKYDAKDAILWLQNYQH